MTKMYQKVLILAALLEGIDAVKAATTTKNVMPSPRLLISRKHPTKSTKTPGSETDPLAKSQSSSSSKRKQQQQQQQQPAPKDAYADHHSDTDTDFVDDDDSESDVATCLSTTPPPPLPETEKTTRTGDDIDAMSLLDLNSGQKRMIQPVEPTNDDDDDSRRRAFDDDVAALRVDNVGTLATMSSSSSSSTTTTTAVREPDDDMVSKIAATRRQAELDTRRRRFDERRKKARDDIKADEAELFTLAGTISPNCDFTSEFKEKLNKKKSAMKKYALKEGEKFLQEPILLLRASKSILHQAEDFYKTQAEDDGGMCHQFSGCFCSRRTFRREEYLEAAKNCSRLLLTKSEMESFLLKHASELSEDSTKAKGSSKRMQYKKRDFLQDACGVTHGTSLSIDSFLADSANEVINWEFSIDFLVQALQGALRVQKILRDRMEDLRQEAIEYACNKPANRTLFSPVLDRIAFLEYRQKTRDPRLNQKENNQKKTEEKFSQKWYIAKVIDPPEGQTLSRGHVFIVGDEIGGNTKEVKDRYGKLFRTKQLPRRKCIRLLPRMAIEFDFLELARRYNNEIVEKINAAIQEKVEKEALQRNAASSNGLFMLAWETVKDLALGV